MSGDSNTLTCAMALEPELCVCIYGPNNAAADRLADHFTQRFGARRVIHLVIRDPATLRLIGRGVKKAVDGGPVFASTVAGMARYFGRPPAELAIAEPTAATELMAMRYRTNAAGSRQKLIESLEMPEMEDLFDEYLQGNLRFDYRKKYVFLWSKTDEFHKEKAHHYTDPLTWQLFLDHMHTVGWIPVLVGEPLGLEAPISMVHFWKTSWANAMGYTMDVHMQAALWVHIAKRLGPRCCAIGMRSGSIEVPALIGIRTLYLEEAENEQRQRMAKWLFVVDTWFRGILQEPPGFRQQIYYYESVLKYANKHPLALTLPKPIVPVEAVKCMDAQVRAYVLGALEHIHMTGVAPRPEMDILAQICGFVGRDVQQYARAMNRASLERVVRWVSDGAATERQDAADAQLARSVLESGVMCIQGGAAARQQKGPRQSRGGSAAAAARPSQRPRGFNMVDDDPLLERKYAEPPRFDWPLQNRNPMLAPVVPLASASASASAAAAAAQAQQPQAAQSTAMVPYVPPQNIFRHFAMQEHQLLAATLRLLRPDQPAYRPISARLTELATQYGLP
ncbi:MAG: hypothetical protein HYX47_18505 [Burkholderiales bacterium]|nr:hypothetical protein [Burkholderiales bacterium]